MSLWGCSEISDAGASSLAQHCPRLHALCLSGTQVTDTGLASIGEGCRALKKNFLIGLAISDMGLRKIAEGCSRLEEVHLRDCRNISNVGAWSLAQHCPRLHSLSLTRTQVSSKGKASLRTAFPALRFLYY